MWSLLAGAVAIAFAPIFVKAVLLPASVIGYYRCGVAFLVLILVSLFWRYRNGGIPSAAHPRYWISLVGAGLFFACDLYAWHMSIHFIGAGIGTLLANSSAIYLAIIGVLFLGEKPSWRFTLCLFLALVGVSALVGFPDPEHLHDRYEIGIALGLLTGLFYSGFIFCVRFAERAENTLLPWERLAVISLVTTIVLGGVAFGQDDVVFATGMDLVWLVLLALVAQVMGWMLIARGLKQVTVGAAGVGLLVQPVTAIVLGAVIFDETLNLWQVLGAVLTLIAIYLGTVKPKVSDN